MTKRTCIAVKKSKKKSDQKRKSKIARALREARLAVLETGTGSLRFAPTSSHPFFIKDLCYSLCFFCEAQLNIKVCNKCGRWLLMLLLLCPPPLATPVLGIYSTPRVTGHFHGQGTTPPLQGRVKQKYIHIFTAPDIIQFAFAVMQCKSVFYQNFILF